MTDTRHEVGTFAVSVGADEVAVFRQATGAAVGRDGSVPATFPMRWMAQPDVRDALLARVPDAEVVPVHESQTFDYVRPLTVGEACKLALIARRETNPDRLVVDGAATGPDGTVVVRIEMILRLFSTKGDAA